MVPNCTTNICVVFTNILAEGSVLKWLKPSQKVLKIDETHFLVVTHRFELIFNKNSFYVF